MSIDSKQTNKRKLKVKKRMENTFVKKNVEENEFLFQNMVQRFLPINVPKIFAYLYDEFLIFHYNHILNTYPLSFLNCK